MILVKTKRSSTEQLDFIIKFANETQVRDFAEEINVMFADVYDYQLHRKFNDDPKFVPVNGRMLDDNGLDLEIEYSYDLPVENTAKLLLTKKPK